MRISQATVRMIKNHTLITAALVSLLLSCRKPVAQSPDESVADIQPKQRLAWLALGDSYTIGEGVKADETYPAQTTAMLAKQGFRLDTTEILAVTGYTTEDLQSRMNNTRFRAPYKFVSLAIGVNDQYQRHDTTGYRERFSRLLQSAIQLSSKRSAVFVLSIPDYSLTPFARYYNRNVVQKELGNFNKINREVASANGCTFINVTTLSAEVLQDRELLCADSLHYSEKMYAKWALLLAAKMKDAF